MQENNTEEYLNNALSQLREKQYKCTHPSLKCPLCSLYIDNINNQYKQIIKKLLEKNVPEGVIYVIKHETLVVNENYGIIGAVETSYTSTFG